MGKYGRYSSKLQRVVGCVDNGVGSQRDRIVKIAIKPGQLLIMGPYAVKRVSNQINKFRPEATIINFLRNVKLLRIFRVARRDFQRKAMNARIEVPKILVICHTVIAVFLMF